MSREKLLYTKFCFFNMTRKISFFHENDFASKKSMKWGSLSLCIKMMYMSFIEKSYSELNLLQTPLMSHREWIHESTREKNRSE
jgi:hypothetical protein